MRPIGVGFNHTAQEEAGLRFKLAQAGACGGSGCFGGERRGGGEDRFDTGDILLLLFQAQRSEPVDLPVGKRDPEIRIGFWVSRSTLPGRMGIECHQRLQASHGS